MNSATLFLVAVTVFTLVLEASATPAAQPAEVSNRVAALITSITANLLGSADDTVHIDEEFIQFAHEAIEGAKRAFDDAQTVIGMAFLPASQQETHTLFLGDALISATGEEKDNLEEIIEWLDEYLAGTVGDLSEELLNARDSGTISALKEVKANINEAIAYTIETMDGFNDKLPEGDTKDGFNAAVDIILELSAQVAEYIEGILAGVNA